MKFDFAILQYFIDYQKTQIPQIPTEKLLRITAFYITQISTDLHS